MTKSTLGKLKKLISGIFCVVLGLFLGLAGFYWLYTSIDVSQLKVFTYLVSIVLMALFIAVVTAVLIAIGAFVLIYKPRIEKRE